MIFFILLWTYLSIVFPIGMGDIVIDILELHGLITKARQGK